MGKHNITAIIYDKRNRIISIGKNSYVKTHPMQAKAALHAGEPHKVFLHAELAALIKLKDWDRAHKMVVFRHTKDGNPACAAPCKSCSTFLSRLNLIVEHT